MGEEVFNLDGILNESLIDSLGLFQDDSESETQTNTDQPQEVDTETNNKTNSETTEIDPKSIFGGESESVGSGEHQDIQEKQSSVDLGDSSPKNSVYSSIAKAFYEDDVFPDLDDSDIEAVTDADSFKELIDKQVEAKLNEIQKRVYKALDNNVPASQVQQYEGALNYLNSISDEMLTAESEQGEEIRKRIIYSDYINKGFSKERAVREVKKSLDNGTDIEDARDAMESNKQFYATAYRTIQDNAQKETNKVREQQTKEARALKTSIEEDNYMGDITLDKTTRRKIFDVIAKPRHKDPDTGKTYTDLQKYEKEHKPDFIKYVGTIYTLTDGFKNFDAFVKGKVRKEVNKNIRELESKLANTSRNSNGTLTFMSGSSSDNDTSPFAAGWKLNV